MPPWRLPAFLPPAPAERAGERGFLMAGATIILLVVIAILSSMNFVFTTDASFRANYAAGQRLADIAVLAHNYAQTRHYQLAPTPNVPLAPLGNMFTAANMNPPDNLAFGRIGRTALSLDIRGMDNAPFNGVAPAASAYLHLKIRPDAGIRRRPNETVAFAAGASKHDMSRIGIVGQNVAGDTCDGQATRVRWGPEASACLNATQIAALGFTDVQNNDVIVPAWETALARMGENIVLRFPQPERPDMNMMNVDLAMNGGGVGNQIRGINTTDASQITSTGTSTIQNMRVRSGATTTLNGPSAYSGGLDILDDTGGSPVMTVSGAVNFTSPTLSVQDTLQHGSGNLDVTVANNAIVNRVGVVGIPGSGINTTIEPISGSPSTSVAVQQVDPTSTIRDISTGDTLSVAAAFNTTAGGIEGIGGAPIDIFAAELVTRDTAQVINMGNWNIGTIDQRNTTGGLRIDRIRAEVDCIGTACPDNVNQTPDEEPF